MKIYRTADVAVPALRGLDLIVEPGEFIALVGASGSGKSTLLHILGGLDVPTAGRASVAGRALEELSPRQRTAFRRRVVGFVWQQPPRNLLPYLTAAENLQLPMLLAGVPPGARTRRSTELLRAVGLEQRAGHRPDRLSGGEQQRLSIGIALANEPAILLADEPTGELDTESAEDVYALLGTVNRDRGVTIVLVTHDLLVRERVTRTIAINDGRISADMPA